MNRLAAAVIAIAGFTASWAQAQPKPVENAMSTEQGFGVFQRNCLTCHGTAAYPQAPSPMALREMTPERIYDALTTGVMKPIGDKLSDLDKRQVAESAAGRLLGSSTSGNASEMPNQCGKDAPALALGKGTAWPNWGGDLGNTRFQPAGKTSVSAANVKTLKLKWAFGLPHSTSSYSQPTVAGGWVFVGADTGTIYAIDEATGCVHWSFKTKSGVRNAMVVGPGAGGKPMVYFGDLRANVYGLDARTGQQVWTVKVDNELASRVTASPALYQGRLYVPVSSWEEFAAKTVEYGCCRSVGAVLALDAATGRQIWKTMTIPGPLKVLRTNSKGVDQYGPAGAPVWNTPTIDPVRHAVYFGTGDATTYPAAETSDAVMALDMDTGKMLWSYQVHSKDSFLVGCRAGDTLTENCPKVQGPDWDIPAPAILTTAPGGKRLILVGTKPGDVLALDPDNKGALVWRVNVSGPKLAGDGPAAPTPVITGVLWGGAVENGVVYYGLTGGGMAALKVATGERVWRAPLNSSPQAPISHGSPSTAVPGAVFVGGIDGKLHAVSTKDGAVLWTAETARPFDTVNKVQAKGGSIISGGPTVAGGMVFIGSGYAVNRGAPGNVVLAYGVN